MFRKTVMVNCSLTAGVLKNLSPITILSFSVWSLLIANVHPKEKTPNEP